MPSLSISMSIRGQLLSGTFSPIKLKDGSSAFAWYDPSDLTTLFQDSAGTTPVTSPSQPVGLMLDKSQGLTLGPELVTNGDFSNGTTGWSSANNGILTVTSGVLTVTNNVTSFGGASQSFTTVVGATYKIMLDFIKGTASGCAINIGTTIGSGGIAQILATSSGSISGYFKATSTTTFVSLLNNTTTNGANSSFDNISVRELPGYHATQSTTGNRPIYAVMPKTGVRNLLTYTEQFDNAAWAKTGTTVSANTAIAPDGTATADVLSTTATTAIFVVGQNLTLGANTCSIFAKAGTSSFLQLTYNGDTTSFANFNLSSGETGASGGTVIHSIIPVGNGWYRCSVYNSSISVTGITWGIVPSVSTTRRQTFTATGAENLYIWGAQLETGSTSTAYQKVVSKYEVTEAGVPTLPYLSFNGATSSMVTSTITPNADKVQVFAGVRKLSDAAQGVITELSTTVANAGSFYFSAPALAREASYGFTSNGTLLPGQIKATIFASPITNVVSAFGDILANLRTIRVNSSQAAQSTESQGTGNYLSYPLYIGARAGTSQFFNGNLYGLIVRFATANLDASVITSTENWMNTKTGAY